MKNWVIFFMLLVGSSAWAHDSTMGDLAAEIRNVSGKFHLISKDSRQHLGQLQTRSVPQAVLEAALQSALPEMDKAEAFEGVSSEAVSVSDSSGAILGYIVFPITYLAIPEGDTDYYVIYYVFVSAGGEVETQFKVYQPLF